MGSFINTEYKSTISDLVVGFKERMKNPFWTYADKTPTVVTYYKINHEKSMLDKGTGLEYSRLSDKSPLKYNKIEGFLLYGIEKITVSLQDGDWGVESDPIEGEAIILPDTIEPTAGDYFAINYVNERLLFRVNSVNMDTLEDGANFWQISYKLDQTDNNLIENQIVDNYNMIVNNVGTKFKSIIKSSEYNIIEVLDNFIERLKEYYINIFFEDRVQTFIFYMGEARLYDPYMIEFLIRNNILKRERNKYIHIAHQLEVDKTFSIDYDCSLFRSFELKDKNIADRIFSNAILIDQPNSTFNCRSENYYSIKYIRGSNGNLDAEVIININPALAEAIREKELFREEDSKSRYNLIIKYFNNMEYDSKDIEAIENIMYQNNIELFYLMPFYIYIMQDYIKKLLTNI